MKTNNNQKTPGLDCGFGSENKALDYAFQLVEEAAPPKKREGRDLVVCSATEIPEGGRRTVADGKRSIGVFRIGGQFYALLNVCPHMGAPLCVGKLHGTHRPSEVHEYDPAFHGRILRCPWHGWEFDVMTGKGLYDRHGRAATFPVRVDSHGDVVVTV